MPAVTSSKNAFTLVEMMTAIAILALLTAIIFSIMGMALRVTDSTTRGGDTAVDARQVLDRIGEDISGMLIRPDVDQYYEKLVGNDQMFFYSQTAGYFAANTTSDQESPVSLVGYRISWPVNTTTPPVLQRLAQGLNWSGPTALTFLTFPAVTLPPRVPHTPPPAAYQASSGTIPVQWSSLVNDSDTAASFWSTTSNQVFRLEIVYQLRDGTFTLTPPTPSIPPAITLAKTQPLPVVPGNVNDTVGIVVAIAVLDNKSRQIVPLASWGTLISALRDPTAGDLTASPAVLMDSTWNTALNESSFATTAGIPVAAASQIRVYQRYYPLNAPKFQ